VTGTIRWVIAAGGDLAYTIGFERGHASISDVSQPQNPL